VTVFAHECLPRVKIAPMTLPKLNLRDLFWLVVVVALGLGWWRANAFLQVERTRRLIEQARSGESEAAWFKLYDATYRDYESLRGQLEQVQQGSSGSSSD
jgi:hypothetical protein